MCGSLSRLHALRRLLMIAKSVNLDQTAQQTDVDARHVPAGWNLTGFYFLRLI